MKLSWSESCHLDHRDPHRCNLDHHNLPLIEPNNRNVLMELTQRKKSFVLLLALRNQPILPFQDNTLISKDRNSTQLPKNDFSVFVCKHFQILPEASHCHILSN